MTLPPEPPTGGRDEDDVDAEFARLMEGIELDEPAAEDPLTVEDVLSAPAAEAPRPIAVVATSVASAKALAGAIRLGSEARGAGHEVPAGTRVVATDTGAIAVGALDEADAHEFALTVSAALQKLGIILFFRQGDRMTATRYRQGRRGDDVAPAIVLGGVDDAVEQVLLGAVEVSELGEGIDPSTVSRMQALRWVATGRRRR